VVLSISFLRIDFKDDFSESSGKELKRVSETD
ncbi:uncharacterized protein METZ01_LOCUS286791, partial [marine metagenome]